MAGEELTPEEYVRRLTVDINRKRESGASAIYRLNEKISDSTAHYTKLYFEEKGFSVELKRCKHCTHTWDITIRFF